MGGLGWEWMLTGATVLWGSAVQTRGLHTGQRINKRLGRAHSFSTRLLGREPGGASHAHTGTEGGRPPLQRLTALSTSRGAGRCACAVAGGAGRWRRRAEVGGGARGGRVAMATAGPGGEGEAWSGPVRPGAARDGAGVRCVPAGRPEDAFTVLELSEYAKSRPWWRRVFAPSSGSSAEKYNVATQLVIGGLTGW